MRLLLLVAALAAFVLPASAAIAPADSGAGAYRSEQALRHYLQGRWLEEAERPQDAQAEFSRALSLDPGAADVMLHLAELAANSGESGRSLELADRILGDDPGNARALWLRGAALFNLGRAGEAIGPLEAASRADSLNPDYARTLARVAEALDRLPVVFAAWERVTRLDDEDAEAWFQLATVAMRVGRFGLADSALDRSDELNPVRPGALLLRGWIRQYTGRPAEAAEFFRRHLEIHSGDQATRRQLVLLLLRLKRPGEAFRESQRLAAARPEDPDALQLEADCAFASGNEVAGTRALASLRALAPDDPGLVLRSVAVLARHDRSDEALRVVNEWTRVRADDERALSLAARARAIAGRYDSAAVYARRLVEATPDSVDARTLLARIYQDSRRWPEAVEAWRAARALAPDDPQLMLDQGYCLERAGDIAGAIELGRKALERAPEMAGALNFLGYLLADNGRDLEEALGLVTRALAQDPDNGAYVDSYGWVLYRLGRLAEARTQLENALAITGGDPEIHEHLGDVYRDLRMLDRAREQYRASLAADSRNTRVRNKLQQLR
ncbi:MAG: tetratricopeptide repeat protein [Candidatus Eisenbacteria bacterium]|nr:tetratricopeptide repeat protein [Candidatus Eisenbacteria bacterium]